MTEPDPSEEFAAWYGRLFPPPQQSDPDAPAPDDPAAAFSAFIGAAFAPPTDPLDTQIESETH